MKMHQYETAKSRFKWVVLTRKPAMLKPCLSCCLLPIVDQQSQRQKNGDAYNLNINMMPTARPNETVASKPAYERSVIQSHDALLCKVGLTRRAVETFVLVTSCLDTVNNKVTKLQQ
jgi:hypothetical protein